MFHYSPQFSNHSFRCSNTFLFTHKRRGIESLFFYLSFPPNYSIIASFERIPSFRCPQESYNYKYHVARYFSLLITTQISSIFNSFYFNNYTDYPNPHTYNKGDRPYRKLMKIKCEQKYKYYQKQECRINCIHHFFHNRQ